MSDLTELRALVAKARSMSTHLLTATQLTGAELIHIANTVDAITDALPGLLDRLEAAEADAARMDWMAKHLLRDASMRFDDGTFKAVKAWSIASHNDDLRVAIDASREAAP